MKYANILRKICGQYSLHTINPTLNWQVQIGDLSEDILSTSKPNLNAQMPKSRRQVRNALKISGDWNTTAL